MPYFAPIGEGVAEKWTFFFDFWRWWPSAIFDFSKFEILTVIYSEFGGPIMRYHAKFRADRSNRCADMAVFRFFKSTAVRHLGFVIRLFGPLTKSIWWDAPTRRLVWILACGSYRRCNHKRQILWQSVQEFRSSDIPKFAILHRNSWSSMQQCKHYRATLW